MVSLRALVDRCGLVLPSRKGPHSGWPLLAQPLGSAASASRSLKPIGVDGQPSAFAIGWGMAMVSGVRRKDLGLAGAMAGCPLVCSASFSTAPHADAAGVQITGLGSDVSLAGHPCDKRISPAPD